MFVVQLGCWRLKLLLFCFSSWLLNKTIIFGACSLCFLCVPFLLPFSSLTLGDLLCVSILDLARILGSTWGWFSCHFTVLRFTFTFVFLCTLLGYSYSVRLSDHGGAGLVYPDKWTCPYLHLSQGIRPFVAPLASPEMVSSRFELGVLNQLRFRDPDNFRAGTIHHSLPLWERLLGDYSCSAVDLLEIIRDGVRVERFFYPV